MNSGKRHTQAPRRHRPAALLGVALIVVGALMLVAGGGYYAYSANARSQLDDLNFTVADAAPDVERRASQDQAAAASLQPNAALQPLPPAQPQLAATAADRSAAQSRAAAAATAASQVPIPAAANPADAPSPANSTTQQSDARAPLPPSSYAALYPATQIHPKFWGEPLWADSEPYLYAAASPAPALPPGFRALSATDDALEPGEGAFTTRMTIPAIGVDSDITELAILNIGSSNAAYETPAHLVGHIPQSPNPGELGNAWYFGHLESPIRGEGSVFKRLPEIPALLRDGDDVFVQLATQDGRTFLYKVSETEVMHQDDLRMYTADSARITLVACVPRLVYDHRILVTAELVGVADAQETVH